MVLPQRRYEMDRAPTAADSTHRLSYRVGDTWFDESSGKTYVMRSGAKCKAVWDPLASVVAKDEEAAKPRVADHKKPTPVASTPLSQNRPVKTVSRVKK